MIFWPVLPVLWKGVGVLVPTMCIISQSGRRLDLRNYEGVIAADKQPVNVFSDCSDCRRCGDDRDKPLDGVATLLAGEKVHRAPQGPKR